MRLTHFDGYRTGLFEPYAKSKGNRWYDLGLIQGDNDRRELLKVVRQEVADQMRGRASELRREFDGKLANVRLDAGHGLVLGGIPFYVMDADADPSGVCLKIRSQEMQIDPVFVGRIMQGGEVVVSVQAKRGE